MNRELLQSQPERSTVRPAELEAYDRVVARQKSYGYAQGTPGYPKRPTGQEAGPYFGALLKAPVIADHISELGAYYRTRGEVEGSFSHADREWVDIVLGQHLGFNMWGHILDGIAVGVRPEAVLAILEHREDGLEADESRFAAFIRRFADGRLDDADLAFVHDRFGLRGAVEYTAWIGHLTMTLRLIQAFLGRTAPSDAEAAERLRQFIASGEPLPDPRARIPRLDVSKSDDDGDSDAEEPAANAGPLANVRIVEFAAIGPVPYGTMLLADLGAEVLTIDRAEATWPQLPVLTRGRSRLVLNLKDARELDTAREALRHADVLIEGFRPGVMERLGLGPDLVCRDNPGLIYTRMTGWGQEGPLATTAGHDINYIALSGLLGLLGRDKAPPDPPLNWLGDYAAGSLFMVVGILAALLERARSGQGQVLDVSVVDGAASLLAPILGMHRAGLLDLQPDRNLLAGRAPFYRTYRCSDGRDLAVGPLEREFQQILATKLGVEVDALTGDAEEGSRALAALFRSRPRADWLSLFEGTDACVTPVLSLEEAAAHPHLSARQAFITREGAVEPAPAPRFSRTPTVIREAADAQTLLKQWRTRSVRMPIDETGAATKRK